MVLAGGPLQIPQGLMAKPAKPQSLHAVNFAPEKFALWNERHLRLLDYRIGLPYL